MHCFVGGEGCSWKYRWIFESGCVAQVPKQKQGLDGSEPFCSI